VQPPRQQFLAQAPPGIFVGDRQRARFCSPGAQQQVLGTDQFPAPAAARPGSAVAIASPGSSSLESVQAVADLRRAVFGVAFTARAGFCSRKPGVSSLSVGGSVSAGFFPLYMGLLFLLGALVSAPAPSDGNQARPGAHLARRPSGCGGRRLTDGCRRLVLWANGGSILKQALRRLAHDPGLEPGG